MNITIIDLWKNTITIEGLKAMFSNLPVKSGLTNPFIISKRAKVTFLHTK